jgi:hypothetical protein
VLAAVLDPAAPLTAAGRPAGRGEEEPPPVRYCAALRVGRKN